MWAECRYESVLQSATVKLFLCPFLKYCKMEIMYQVKTFSVCYLTWHL